MNEQEWNKIRYFTEGEIRATGADPKDVQLPLMLRLDIFRETIGRPVHLVRDGLTTGIHKSPGHPKGLAADGYLSDESVSFDSLFKSALHAGFRAIGIYFNGVIYSFHLEIDVEYRFWAGVKEKPMGPGWEYVPLVVDPKTYLK